MPISDWTDTFLDQMRQVGDPVADRVVESLYAGGQVSEVNRLLGSLVNLDDVPSELLPDVANAYFVETAALPEWINWDDVLKGQEVFSRLGPMAVLALNCASLPECYAAAQGAEVLLLSGRMSKNPGRRIIETAQFVIDVMAPGGLGPDGVGIRTIQKVRLIHAAVRFLVKKHGQWDPESGTPINQEDQAGTLLAFSWVVLRCLKQISVDFEPEEKRAYLHAWRVVGHFLGVDERFLTDDPEEARALVERIQTRHHRASPAGRELTKVLIDQVGEWLPGRFMDGVVVAMMRHWLSPEVVEYLDIPKAGWTRMLIGPLCWLNRVLDSAADESAPVRRFTQAFGRKLVNHLHHAYRGEHRTEFLLPESLRKEWRIAD